MEGGCCMEEGLKDPQIGWSCGGGSETCGMYQMHLTSFFATQDGMNM
jgi:hypothetical protein